MKKTVTWAHRATTKRLEGARPAIESRAVAAQLLVTQVIAASVALAEDHPEVVGAQVIAESIRDRTRDRLALVDEVLATREDRFDLDATVDRILEGEVKA